MKLNYKRTVLVGFAFFLICAFWQIYDVTIAMTLTSKFGLSQTISGIVMALDNILALFLLPLFGGISDRCKSKSGSRTPFIRIGTILAVVFLLALSFVDTDDIKSAEECYNKALSILSTCKNGECEMAVTYCNMAYMYHKANPEDERINEVMSKAEICLESPKLTRDGYYAFTASKCYSAFEYFGFFIYADKLKKISEKIYESNR